MFSPTGVRKQMVINLKRAASLGIPIKELVEKDEQSLSDYSDRSDGNTSEKSGKSGRRSYTRSYTSGTVSDSSDGDDDYSGPNYIKLSKLITESSVAGSAVRKVAESAYRFNKGRDAILIKAFETSSLDYAEFRVLLKRMFFLSFTDEEYVHVTHMFDTNSNGAVNGSDFILCFIILAKIMKDIRRSRNVQHSRARQSINTQHQEDIIKKKNDKELGVEDYNYSENDKQSAIEKITTAAHKFDRTHHAAKSLKQFDVAYLNPFNFRATIRSTFEVNVSDKELGALIHFFNKGESGNVICEDFLLWFLTTGYTYRLEKRSQQVLKTRLSSMEQIMEDEKLKEKQEIEFEAAIDMDYTDADVTSMRTKIADAAAKYDKTHPNAVSLQGFNSKYCTPALFREMLKRTFQIALTDKEAGSLLHDYEGEKKGLIFNKGFLVSFIRLGCQERFKTHTAQLEKERRLQEKANENHEKQLLADWKRDDAIFDPYNFTESDMQRTLHKIKTLAHGYHHDHSSACDLSPFNGCEMGPAEFREMAKRQMNISFTYPEVAALMNYVGSSTDPKKIHTGMFVIKLKFLANDERNRRRLKQLERTESVEKERQEDLIKKRERAVLKLNEVVDYDYSQADYDSGVRKMSQAAAKYDKNHPSSMSLDAFQSLVMTPGVFSKMVQRTFQVKLSGKELGAIIELYDANGDGFIDTGEFLSNFFGMQREYRNIAREERNRKILKKKEEERQRITEKMIKLQNLEAKRLKFKERDKNSLFRKLCQAAQLFALDNAPYVEPMNLFKKQALTATSLRDNFFRIYLIKFTYPECGALMHIVNPKFAEDNIFDGVTFITLFYKLSRLLEQALLGKIEMSDISINDLKLETVEIGRSLTQEIDSKVADIINEKDFLERISDQMDVSDRAVSRGCGDMSLSPSLHSDPIFPSIRSPNIKSFKSKKSPGGGAKASSNRSRTSSSLSTLPPCDLSSPDSSPSGRSVFGSQSRQLSPQFSPGRSRCQTSNSPLLSPSDVNEKRYTQSAQERSGNSMLTSLCGGINPWIDGSPASHRRGK